MLFLACKCVFYRLGHNAMWRPHVTEYQRSWNAKNKIYQRIELTE